MNAPSSSSPKSPSLARVDEVAERRLVAGEHAQVEQRRRRREVRLGERHRVGHAEHLVTDGERRVPERIEERLGERGRVSRVDLASSRRRARRRRRSGAPRRRGRSCRPPRAPDRRARPRSSPARRVASRKRESKHASRNRALARPSASPSSPVASRSARTARCRSTASRRRLASGDATGSVADDGRES